MSIDVEKNEVIRQLANYCFGEGMKYGVLTNGSAWVLFRAFQEGTKLAERIVWKTDIEKDDTTTAMRKLNTISKANIGDIETLIEKLHILDKIWQSIMDEPECLVKGFVPVFNSLIVERYPAYIIEHSEIEDFVKYGVRKLFSRKEEAVTDSITVDTTTSINAHLREMKIGTDIYKITYAKDILVNTAEWLIKKGKLKKDDCPIEAGPQWNLVNIHPKHRNGNDFYAARK